MRNWNRIRKERSLWQSRYQPTYEGIRNKGRWYAPYPFCPLPAYLWGIETTNGSINENNTCVTSLYEELKHLSYALYCSPEFRYQPTYENWNWKRSELNRAACVTSLLRVNHGNNSPFAVRYVLPALWGMQEYRAWSGNRWSYQPTYEIETLQSMLFFNAQPVTSLWGWTSPMVSDLGTGGGVPRYLWEWNGEAPYSRPGIRYHPMRNWNSFAQPFKTKISPTVTSLPMRNWNT